MRGGVPAQDPGRFDHRDPAGAAFAAAGQVERGSARGGARRVAGVGALMARSGSGRLPA